MAPWTRCSASPLSATRYLRMLPALVLLHVMLGCYAKVHNGTSPASHLAAIHRSNALSDVRPQHKAQQRELLEGLDCDLQIYSDFVDSDEGQDIFLMATMCESRILYVKNQHAGFYGPVEQADLRFAMCSDECIKSDALHQLAMSRSRCSCAQVSATAFVTHDFCLESSARLLCTHLGECGHWNCALEDFTCLRYKWDKLYPCASLRVAGNMAFFLGCFMALLLVM